MPCAPLSAHHCPARRLSPATGALTVEKYRVIHIIIFDQTDHHGSLLHSLHLIQSLGEEVNAHGNACRDGALYVLLVSGIDNQRTCRRTPVSTADNGKFHTRILHRLPVDFLIPLGNIDAELRAAFVKLQLHILCAVRILLGAVDRLILLFPGRCLPPSPSDTQYCQAPGTRYPGVLVS